ncbi:hypothetical protein AB0893_06195 [Micromonospora aurantiaca]|uniref:hypothetical protein n=1 Tax=Micromonospora aurantiaca (nom. illeg.) TaxID=47850 RepID=UPI003452AC42
MAASLGSLAEALRTVPDEARHDWGQVHAKFSGWLASNRAGLCQGILSDLSSLQRSSPGFLEAGARETSSHFVWRLFDDPADYFSIWINEYKDEALVGSYVDSIHNHRYDFCTTILNGWYSHERYSVSLAWPDRHGSAILDGTRRAVTGDSLLLRAHDFHRIPEFDKGTLTLLVKSRERQPWSFSINPETGVVNRHVPANARLSLLEAKLKLISRRGVPS